jgi:hypothetical protein
MQAVLSVAQHTVISSAIIIRINNVNNVLDFILQSLPFGRSINISGINWGVKHRQLVTLLDCSVPEPVI